MAAYQKGFNMKTGVLLVNLGTPDSYKPKDVFKYLIEFLTDPRVIDLPYLKRQVLVRSIIAPLRSFSSAKSYEKIWTSDGSPLLVYGKTVCRLLGEALGDEFVVKLAMRYQNPSIEFALKDLESKNISKLIILPLFPQYSSACTGSVFEKVSNLLSKKQNILPHQFISHFYSSKPFIDAHLAIAKDYDISSYDHILFSFHGLPLSHILKADHNNFCLKYKNCCEKICLKNQMCYKAQCFETTRLIAKELHLTEDSYTTCFQSRLGKDPWLTPFTAKCVQTLPEKGVKNLLVFCPSFVCDCLETLYEIEIEYEEIFKDHGGQKLTLVKGLNDHPLWIEALKNLVLNTAFSKKENNQKVLESMMHSS